MRCMFLGYPKVVMAYSFWCLEPYHNKCITSCDVVFNETEMDFKKSDDTCINPRISKEECDQEEVPIEVEHIENKVHNHEANHDDIAEEAQDV